MNRWSKLTEHTSSQLPRLTTQQEELEQLDMVNKMVDVYQAVAFRAHRHSFHDIRSAAVLVAEILLRISGTESGWITVSARDALLPAAMNDASFVGMEFVQFYFVSRVSYLC